VRESEERLRAALEASGTGTYLWDLENGVVERDDNLCRMMGWPAEESPKALTSFVDAIHPEDRDAVAAAVKHFGKEGGSFWMDYRVIRPDGSIRWLADRGRVIHDNEGRPRTVIGACVDVTDRKQMEEMLRISQERFRTALVNTPVIVFNHDIALRYTWVYNQEPDVPLDQIIGRTDAEILGAEAAAEVTAIKAAVLASGVGRRCEVQMLLPRGPQTYDFTVEPLRDGAGRIVGITCAAVNITERKRAEEALQAAMREAERASAAKSRFLATANHDLRQPIQSLVLLAGVLAKRNKDPSLAAVVSKVHMAVDSLRQMLDVLLDISRMDAGSIQAAPQDFPARFLLDRLAGDFTLEAGAKGLRFRHVPTRLVLNSDPQLLERILRNLLSNALRYTEHGGVLLSCRHAGRGARIEVWDTGCGIPPDEIEMIFDEFYQVGTPGRDRGKGLGLGLAIVNRLAGLLGHRIGVRSRVGRGSVFTIEVPLGAGPCRPAVEPEATGRAANGRLIVLVDDDPGILEALGAALELAGWTVVAATTAEQAVERVLQHDRIPAVILADYRLGDGKTGHDAVCRLRAAFGDAIPGVLLTGDTSPERLREAQAGDCLLLHKPVTATDLLQVLERAVRGRAVDPIAARPVNDKAATE
jgi:PAS domain S-box-containing protein